MSQQPADPAPRPRDPRRRAPASSRPPTAVLHRGDQGRGGRPGRLRGPGHPGDLLPALPLQGPPDHGLPRGSPPTRPGPARPAAPGPPRRPAGRPDRARPGARRGHAHPGFRGCPYANLTAEYCDQDHPARTIAGRAPLLAPARGDRLLDKLGVARASIVAEQTRHAACRGDGRGVRRTRRHVAQRSRTRGPH